MIEHHKHEYQGAPSLPDELHLPHEFHAHTGVLREEGTKPTPYEAPQEFPHPHTLAPKAPDLLDAMARTFRERNAVYKDNWITCGQVFRILFPDGVKIETQEQHEMFGILYQIVGKLTRFAGSGCTHQDSIHDLAVYSAIAEHLLLKNDDDGKIGV